MIIILSTRPNLFGEYPVSASLTQISGRRSLKSLVWALWTSLR